MKRTYQKVTSWHTQFEQGVQIRIKNWNMPSLGECWTYYLVFPAFILPEVTKDTSDTKVESLLSDLPWHGGITWCSYEDRNWMVGCDYQHADDQGKVYTLSDIQRDAEATVKAFLTKFKP